VENTERGWRDLILNKIRAVFGFGVWVFFIASLKCRISSIYLSAMKSELLNAWGLFWFLKTFLDNSVHTVVILLNCMSCHSCFLMTKMLYWASLLQLPCLYSVKVTNLFSCFKSRAVVFMENWIQLWAH
jgi:hypothetical protein